MFLDDDDDDDDIKMLMLLLSAELPELKFAFNCLFQDCQFGDSALLSGEDGGGESSFVKKFDAEAVFNQIDKDKIGRIDINKFKVDDRTGLSLYLDGIRVIVSLTLSLCVCVHVCHLSVHSNSTTTS